MYSKVELEVLLQRACHVPVCLGTDASGSIPVESKSGITFTNYEYIGALSDFTGELGRMAVSKATSRDIDGINDVLNTNKSILNALYSNNIARIPVYQKKCDAIVANNKKIVELLYDMKCYELSGGHKGSQISNATGPNGDSSGDVCEE